MAGEFSFLPFRPLIPFALMDFASGSLVFDYSKTLNPWGIFNSTTDKFAFVKVTSTNMLNVTPFLIRIFRPNDIAIPAIATAGPVGTGYCNIMPFFLCATIGAPCNATECYGYKVGEIRLLEQPNKDSLYSAGNYGLLSSTTGSGANQIKLDLQGRAISSCSQIRSSKTGVASGPVNDGINYRIDSLDSNHNDYLTQEIYDSLSKQDIKALINPSITSTPYIDYKVANGNGSRVMSVAFANCSIMKNGIDPKVPLVGNGCVFINQHVPNGSAKVYIEYINSCQQSGIFDPSHATLNGGFKIVLFKSLSSSDS